MKILAAIVMLFCVGAAIADVTHKIEVNINHVGNDPIGKQLAYRLQEEVRKSALMELTKFENSIVDVKLVTLSLDEANEQNSHSAYSMTVLVTDPRTFQSVFYTSFVGHFGAQKIEAAAGDLIVDIAKIAEGAPALRATWRKVPLK